MPIDPNIALQVRAPQFDSPLESMGRTLTLKNLATQNALQEQQLTENQGVKEAFRKNLVTSPDGTTSLNKGGALSDLYKVNPAKGIDYQKMFQGQDLDELKRNTEVAKTLAWSVREDGSNYQDIRANALQMKIPNADKLPEQYMPNFVKSWQLHTLSGEEQLKKQEIDAKREDTKETRMARFQKQADEKNEKRFLLLKDDLDPNKARGGNMSFNQKKVDQAERLEGLIYGSSGNINNLDSRQIEELAIGLNSMLSNSSSSAVSQVEALVPKTVIGNAQKLKEWLSNDPQGTNQVAFVKRMAETVGREKEIAGEQVKKAQIARLAAHSHLEKADPLGYQRILQSYGIDPSEIKDGKYVPKEKKQPPGNEQTPPIQTKKTHEIDWAD